MADDKSSDYIKAKIPAGAENMANEAPPAATRSASLCESQIVNRQLSIY